MKEQTATYALKLAKCAQTQLVARRELPAAATCCCCHFSTAVGALPCTIPAPLCGSLQISNYLGQYQTISRTQKCRVWCCTYASALAYFGAHPARTAPPNTAPHLLTTPPLHLAPHPEGSPYGEPSAVGGGRSHTDSRSLALSTWVVARWWAGQRQGERHVSAKRCV